MALSLQSASLVRQKTRAFTRNPLVKAAIDAFFRNHATNKGNADLELVNLDDADVTGTNGVVSADAACVLHFVFLRKRGTATDSYLKLYDDATDDTTAGNERVTLPILEASEDNIVMFPQGVDMATGIVATSHTTSNGTTDSTAGDSGDGFLIIGASGSD